MARGQSTTKLYKSLLARALCAWQALQKPDPFGKGLLISSLGWLSFCQGIKAPWGFQASFCQGIAFLGHFALLEALVAALLAMWSSSFFSSLSSLALAVHSSIISLHQTQPWSLLLLTRRAFNFATLLEPSFSKFSTSFFCLLPSLPLAFAFVKLSSKLLFVCWHKPLHFRILAKHSPQSSSSSSFSSSSSSTLHPQWQAVFGLGLFPSLCLLSRLCLWSHPYHSKLASKSASWLCCSFPSPFLEGFHQLIISFHLFGQGGLMAPCHFPFLLHIALVIVIVDPI